VIALQCCDAREWSGHADAIFTHPYAPLPKQLHGLPTIINLYYRDEVHLIKRVAQTQNWIGGCELKEIGRWGLGLHNCVLVANLPARPQSLIDFGESHWPYVEGVGWFPISLPLKMLRVYEDIIHPPMVVADLFCGRGSVARACELLGLDCVSSDIDPQRVALAKSYLRMR
jgi:hypothetical protein